MRRPRFPSEGGTATLSAMASIPASTAIEPVTGWRTWNLSVEDDGPALWPAGSGVDPWPHRRPVEARCAVPAVLRRHRGAASRACRGLPVRRLRCPLARRHPPGAARLAARAGHRHGLAVGHHDRPRARMAVAMGLPQPAAAGVHPVRLGRAGPRHRGRRALVPRSPLSVLRRARRRHRAAGRATDATGRSRPDDPAVAAARRVRRRSPPPGPDRRVLPAAGGRRSSPPTSRRSARCPSVRPAS